MAMYQIFVSGLGICTCEIYDCKMYRYMRNPALYKKKKYYYVKTSFENFQKNVWF